MHEHERPREIPGPLRPALLRCEGRGERNREEFPAHRDHDTAPIVQSCIRQLRANLNVRTLDLVDEALCERARVAQWSSASVYQRVPSRPGRRKASRRRREGHVAASLGQELAGLRSMGRYVRETLAHLLDAAERTGQPEQLVGQNVTMSAPSESMPKMRGSEPAIPSVSVTVVSGVAAPVREPFPSRIALSHSSARSRSSRIEEYASARSRS